MIDWFTVAFCFTFLLLFVGFVLIEDKKHQKNFEDVLKQWEETKKKWESK